MVVGGGVSKVRVCVSLFFFFVVSCFFFFLLSLSPHTTTTYHCTTNNNNKNTYITLLQKPNCLQRLLNIRNLILQASNTTFVIGFHELIFPND